MFDRAGDWPTLHGLPRLMWIKRHDPKAFDRMGKFMLVSDWVVYRLCGEIAVEPGNASSTLLLDLHTRRWSEELMQRCGLPKEIFPPVVDAGTVLGRVGAAVAEQTGFAPGTLVTGGVADTRRPGGRWREGVGTSAIVGGTYWLDCHIADEAHTDPEYRTRLSCHSERGEWIYEGVGFYVGLTVRWFRDVFGAYEKETARACGLDPYYLLDRLTLDVPAGSYGLQVLFSDVANQQNWRMCAPTFLGWDILDPAKSHRGVFFKAILENACYQAFGEYANVGRITGRTDLPRQLVLSGGAAPQPGMVSNSQRRAGKARDHAGGKGGNGDRRGDLRRRGGGALPQHGRSGEGAGTAGARLRTGSWKPRRLSGGIRPVAGAV